MTAEVTKILYENSSDDTECLRIKFEKVPEVIEKICAAFNENSKFSRPSKEWEQRVEEAAEAYAESENDCYTNDLNGFKAGATYEHEQLQAEIEGLKKENERLKKENEIMELYSKDLINQLDKQETVIDQVREALQELVQVKEWKEKYGKDEHYLKAQPIAWQRAKTLLNSDQNVQECDASKSQSMGEPMAQNQLSTDWEQLREKFFRECCVGNSEGDYLIDDHYKDKPEQLFEWIKNNLK